MINVKLFKSSDGALHGFSVAGHASYSRKGSDIVCAAVSILVINTINSIESFTDEEITVKEDEEQGFIECFFPARRNGSANEDAELLLKSMLLGIASIAEKYGSYIKISEEAPND